MSDLELLKRYVRGQREAFEELVRRHTNWVYSTARRRVQDNGLAEDVCQAVFILLAQKAATIGDGVVLPVWLLRTTCFVANHAIRAEQRRKEHERWAAMKRDAAADQPADDWCWVLDECVRVLGRKDQQAVLLRFYEQMTLAQVGQEMGISEDAARKRISRALQSLKGLMEAKRLAPAVTAAVIGDCLQRNWVQAAPAHLSASGSAAALAGLSATTRATSIAKGANVMLMWNKAKMAAAVALLILLPGLIWAGHAWMRADGAPDLGSANPNGVTSKDSGPDYVMGSTVQPQASYVLMTYSPDHQRAWGFSIPSGKWLKMPDAPGSSGETIKAWVAGSVAIFQQGSEVYGFSAATGTWDTLSAPAGQKGEEMVAMDVGAFKFSDKIFAFSGATGTWDSFNVPVGMNPEVTVASDLAYARVGTNFWAFSCQKGKWDVVDVSAK